MDTQYLLKRWWSFAFFAISTGILLPSCHQALKGPIEGHSNPKSSTNSQSLSACELFAPFENQITAAIDGSEVIELTRFSKGGTGLVYINKARTKVYKVRYSANDPAAIEDAKLLRFLANAEQLFEEEKNLFLDFSQSAGNEAYLQGIKDMLVPSRLVELKVGDRIVEAIEKDFVKGPTLDQLDSLNSDILKGALDDFYENLKLAFENRHRVLDMRDPNIIYDPSNKLRPLTIIDGGYDDTLLSIEEINLLFDFEEICRLQKWCTDRYFEDPLFQMSKRN